jgi:hypothetical protein
MISGSQLQRRGNARIHVSAVGGEAELSLDAAVWWGLNGLETATWGKAVCSHFLEVDCCGHNLDIVQGKLRTLSDDFAIDDN